MSENVSVIAVFNTAKQIKPLWLVRNSEKLKIDEIVSSFEAHSLMVFHCMIAGELNSLQFDILNHRWSVN